MRTLTRALGIAGTHAFLVSTGVVPRLLLNRLDDGLHRQSLKQHDSGEKQPEHSGCPNDSERRHRRRHRGPDLLAIGHLQ